MSILVDFWRKLVPLDFIWEKSKVYEYSVTLLPVLHSFLPHYEPETSYGQTVRKSKAGFSLFNCSFSFTLKKIDLDQNACRKNKTNDR